MSKKTALYDLLGVEPTATADEIRKGYRKMALKYHPDKNRDDENAKKQFIRLKEAYDILSDPRKRSLYDSLGEESVKVLDDPTSLTPEMFINMIRTSPKSLRSQMISILFFVVFACFWFAITFLLKIDGILRWKWLIVLIPLYLFDAYLIYSWIMSIPYLFKILSENRKMEKEAREPVYPKFLEMLNTFIIIIAQVTYACRLDGLLPCSYTLSLLPYFLYAFKSIYLPLIYYKLHQIGRMDVIEEMSNLIYPLTVLLMCLKVDGILHMKWGTTFAFIWLSIVIQVGWGVLMLIQSRSLQMQEQLFVRQQFCRSVCMAVVKIFIAIAILNKISGVWSWKISYIGLPIVGILALVVSCLLIGICGILFGNMEEGFMGMPPEMQQPMDDMTATLNKEEVPNETHVEMDLGMD